MRCTSVLKDSGAVLFVVRPPRASSAALRYVAGMSSRVQAAVPVLYVRSVESAQAFYGLFGYHQTQTGGDSDGAGRICSAVSTPYCWAACSRF